jgi:hypothetical protein
MAKYVSSSLPPVQGFGLGCRSVWQRARLGCSNRRYEVKKFHAYRALYAVAAIVAVVVESGAGHKF